MKIALVHPKFDRSGGAEKYCLELGQGLAERGNEVHLFGRRVQELPGGAVFHRVSSVPVGRALKTYSFWRLSGRAVSRGRFHVVQGFGKTTCQTIHRTGGGVHRAYLAREVGRRPSLYDRVVLRIEDRLFSSPGLRAVLCPSSWVAREVQRYYPACGDRLRRIPNGVDTCRFAPEGRGLDRQALASRLGLPEGAPWVFFAATNFRLKGLDRAVAALAGDRSAVLLVAGGDDPTPFQDQARAAGVGERVRFLGSQKDLAPLYRAADVLVHPTRYDPFANVCLEALACGTPVVTSRENGVADLLEDGRGGLVAGDAPEEIGSALRAIVSRGAAGRASARELACEHDREHHLDAVVSLYRTVVREEVP